MQEQVYAAPAALWQTGSYFMCRIHATAEWSLYTVTQNRDNILPPSASEKQVGCLGENCG